MLVQAAEAIAEKLDKPFARGWAALAAGMAAYLEGRPGDARVLCERAEAVFQGCTGVWWEVGSARLFSSWALFYTGELRELCRRVPQFLAEAEARGDVYNATAFRSSVLNWVWLVDDAPDRADAEVNDSMKRWSRAGPRPWKTRSPRRNRRRSPKCAPAPQTSLSRRLACC